MQRLQKSEILVLVASGSEEAEVSAMTRALRGSGLAVALVGLTAGPVRGAYGITLMPDCTLREVEDRKPQAVVLPGGVQAIRQLATDPRVHHLLRQVVDRGGYVVHLGTAGAVLRCAEIRDTRVHGSRTDSRKRKPTGQVFLEGQVIWAEDAAAVQEAAQLLTSLLGGGT